MARIEIFYKTYTWQLPPIVTESNFLMLKAKLTLTELRAYFTPRFKFLREFWWELSLILLAIMSVVFLVYEIFPSLKTLFEVIVFIGVFAVISFVVSAYNFIDNHLEIKGYYEYLCKAILSSEDYGQFCKIMSNKDFKYTILVNDARNYE